MKNTCDCKEMVLLGTTIAFEISREMSALELARLSGLFYIIADELALLSLCAPDQKITPSQIDEEAAALY